MSVLQGNAFFVRDNIGMNMADRYILANLIRKCFLKIPYNYIFYEMFMLTFENEGKIIYWRKQMKKLLLTSALVLGISSACFASPLSDYSQGKIALDINARPSMDLKVSAQGESGELDGNNTNLDLGLTAGLGNKWAIQYRNSTANSKDFSGDVYDIGVNAHTQLKAQELNALYQFNKNVSGFVGLTKASAKVKGSIAVDGDTYSGEISGKDTNGYQVGVIGTNKIADKTNAYGIISAGNKITNYEIGVSYDVAKDTELNLFYRDTKYKDLRLNDGADFPEFDYQAKGVGYGLTLKF